MDESLLTVAGLHALVYCERLFYFEEVERIRVADRAVYAGRRLHQEIEQDIEGRGSARYSRVRRLGCKARSTCCVVATAN